MEGDSSTASGTAGTAATTKLRKARRSEIYFPSDASQPSDAVYVASFPKIIYFWPTMLAFFICGILQLLAGDSGTEEALSKSYTITWWGITILSLNLLIIVQDFDQKKFIILLLALIVLGLGSWVLDLKGIPVIGSVAGWLKGLKPVFSADAFFLMGGILVVFTVWGLIRPMFDYWRLEPNEFVHYIQPFGRDMSIPRMGHTVNKEIPDILEFILTLGGGTLVIRSGDREAARIPDIPFLGRRMDKIERMLGVTRVTHVDH
jgi:hypothetical protein